MEEMNQLQQPRNLQEERCEVSVYELVQEIDPLFLKEVATTAKQKTAKVFVSI